MSDIIPFKRDVTVLQQSEFDLLITGAGIFGACAAWEAAFRGYRVALIDRGDFGGGVSANSYKIVHGGIRYIQHLDIPRVRSSCHERSALLRIAPHLVHPLPIAIPTYGYGMSGKPVLAAGMYLYDLITADRNRGIKDRQRQIPWSRLMSRNEVLENFPGLETRNLTGAVVFSDAQMYNPPRLVLAFLQLAMSHSAAAVNYVSLEGFRRSGNKIAAATTRKLNCSTAEAFPFLAETNNRYDLIVPEQELNHLTLDEQIRFLRLCRSRLAPGGYVLVYGLNGANPMVGSETLAQNIDHFNTFTEYSLKQLLEVSGYSRIKTLPLKLYGKNVRILSKKIAAIAYAGG